MSAKLYIERCLFVIGHPNAGKSVQLRSTFLDPRFGTGGQIPDAAKLKDTIRLSHERALYLRLTSPHEMNENLDEFLNKIEQKTEKGRWNVAGALQAEPAKRMPELLDIIGALHLRFSPERVRLCFLSPDRHGEVLEHDYVADTIPALQKVAKTEIIFIDARDREANGLVLADFFDFS